MIYVYRMIRHLVEETSLNFRLNLVFLSVTLRTEESYGYLGREFMLRVFGKPVYWHSYGRKIERKAE